MEEDPLQKLAVTTRSAMPNLSLLVYTKTLKKQTKYIVNNQEKWLKCYGKRGRLSMNIDDENETFYNMLQCPSPTLSPCSADSA
jgi:hypothetical protein